MNTYQDTYKHRGLRNGLVAKLKIKGITNTLVLDAIGKIERHFFLPSEFEMHAYEDKAFPIGEGQTISQPYTVAYQTQLLKLEPNDKILEIGTGSGYQTAVLNFCNVIVYSIERHEALSKKAAYILNKLACKKVKLAVGDGTKGWLTNAPYNKIIVTAGAPSIPKILINQLVEGGILVIPVGNENIQKMVRITKLANNELKTEIFEDFSFVPLLGENGWKGK
ncbi:MAG: protein-L-isoaspartate(D-aspartate) O-methyltransferase [Bacteroidetes bacterium]|nr:protein-L-isoaspartate(D-aspartate) O-methyltransferase [Bacteroidota bacterium]